jgi:hypothetical protein
MTEDFHNVLAASDQERLDLFVGTAVRLRTDAENTISTWRQPLPESFALTPHDGMLAALRNGYEAMAGMIFGLIPPLDEIVTCLASTTFSGQRQP